MRSGTLLERPKSINITLDRDLRNGLSKFAHQQTILKGKRFPTIKALRLAVRVCLKYAYPVNTGTFLSTTTCSDLDFLTLDTFFIFYLREI